MDDRQIRLGNRATEGDLTPVQRASNICSFSLLGSFSAGDGLTKSGAMQKHLNLLLLSEREILEGPVLVQMDQLFKSSFPIPISEAGPESGN